MTTSTDFLEVGDDRFLLIPEAECCYMSHFCEENIYKLAEKFHKSQQALMSDGKYTYDGYVVFISSHEKVVPLFMQKLAKNRQSMVVWDYHVIFVVQKTLVCEESCESKEYDVTGPKRRAYILDFDSVLPFGCSAEIYMSKCFPPQFCSRLRPGNKPVRKYSNQKLFACL